MYVLYYLTEKNLHWNSNSAILVMVNLLIKNKSAFPAHQCNFVILHLLN